MYSRTVLSKKIHGDHSFSTPSSDVQHLQDTVPSKLIDTCWVAGTGTAGSPYSTTPVHSENMYMKKALASWTFAVVGSQL